MKSITRKITVNATKTEVWEVLADIGNVHKTNPMVKNSRVTSDQKQGIGATRSCDMAMMNAKLFERVVGWEEGEHIEIDIYDWKNMPGIKAMGAVFTLEELTPNETVVQATINYDMKWGALGSAMDATTMRRQNTKGWERFLAGIKLHVETGEVVNKNTRLETEPVTIPA